jgi:hypothetical protein
MGDYGPLFYSVFLLLGMLVMLEAGRFLALRADRVTPDSDRERLDTIDTAVFALFGLLLAFTFSGAAIRFLDKRMMVAEEANDIGTAYLRLDLLAPQTQPALRQLFREYTDSRIEMYRKFPDERAAAVEFERSKALQSRIWAAAVEGTRSPEAGTRAGLLLLPALNTMIDITTTRAMMREIHPPWIIYGLLFALGLLCSLLAGYRMATRGRHNWLHILGFTVLTVVVIFVMLDIEYPRSGLLRISDADRLLVEVRHSMK